MGTQGIKKLLGFIVMLAVLGGAFLLLKGRGNAGPVTLHISTWSNYFPESIIAEFTKKTGIKVELSYVSSNEELFAKLKAGATGFDIIQPSDYMVRQMAQLKMLATLDHSLLTHLDNLDPYYRKLPYDPGLKVSVPFTWGTTGIALNTSKVAVPAGGVGWDILFHSPDPKHTSMLDDMREVFSGSLFLAAQDPNTTVENALAAARERVAEAKERILMFTSEPKPLLLKGELTVAHVYSSDAIQAGVENKNIKYFIPKEGGIIWTDNFSIPQTSAHIREAHLFIDYFLDPDNALQIITQNHLATPNRVAKSRLPAEVTNNENLYPKDAVLAKLRFLEDIGPALNSMNRLWTELKG